MMLQVFCCKKSSADERRAFLIYARKGSFSRGTLY